MTCHEEEELRALERGFRHRSKLCGDLARNIAEEESRAKELSAKERAYLHCAELLREVVDRLSATG